MESVSFRVNWILAELLTLDAFKTIEAELFTLDALTTTTSVLLLFLTVSI